MEDFLGDGNGIGTFFLSNADCDCRLTNKGGFGSAVNMGMGRTQIIIGTEVNPRVGGAISKVISNRGNIAQVNGRMITAKSNNHLSDIFSGLKQRATLNE